MLAYIVNQEEYSGLLLAANNRKIRWNFSDMAGLIKGKSPKIKIINFRKKILFVCCYHWKSVSIYEFNQRNCQMGL